MTVDVRRPEGRRRLALLEQRIDEAAEDTDDNDGVPTVRRPRTRADCIDGPRPCLFLSCRYHLYFQVRGQSVTLVFPELLPHELEESCVLDIAETAVEDGATYERVANALNVTRSAVRQSEALALAKLARAGMDPRSDDSEQAAAAEE